MLRGSLYPAFVGSSCLRQLLRDVRPPTGPLSGSRAPPSAPASSFLSCTWSRLRSLLSAGRPASVVLVLGRLLARQCEFVVAYRVRRASVLQHMQRTRSTMATGMGRTRQQARNGSSGKGQKSRPLGVLVGAVLFNWEQEKITDDEMEMCACDFMEVERILGKRGSNPKAYNCPGPKDNMSSWELIINKDHLKVWRKPVKNSNLYEYKVFGTFFDIPARAFFRVQVDTEFRKKWDSLVIRLDVIDRIRNLKKKSISEVVHWIMHYPYPMYSRDYVYVRRYMIDQEKNLMLMLSRSTDHPAAPVDKNYVRVTAYRSQMVIRPHTNFDENGMDYVLTYFDDPQAIFPTPAYNWMASSGVPDFVNKLHAAAKNSLHEEIPTVPKPVQEEPGGFRRSKWKTLQQIFA